MTMNYEEIRKMTPEARATKLKEVRDNLEKITLAHKINPLPNPTMLRTQRQLIARLKTAQREEASTKQ